MAEKPRRAVYYVRISDDREGRELGVERQRKDCRALLERLGWTLHPDKAEYNDNDCGASSKSRKIRHDYARLLAAVRAGEVDGIAYYSNSRLTRRPLEYEDIIQLVEDTGVKLTSCVSGQDDLTTADGRMNGRIRASIDAAEAERISERVRRTFVQHREAGRPHSTGMRPFGYQTGGLVAEPREADAIRDGAAMVLAGGSLGDVMRGWNLAGIRPVGGGDWSRMAVRRALTRARVAGLIETRGVLVTDEDGNPRRGTQDAILDVATWRAVRKAVSARSTEVRARYHGREHLLAGVLFCGVCGHRLKVSARRDEAGRVRADSFVSCIKDDGGCGKVKRNLILLEQYVLPAVEARLADVRPFAAPDDDDPEARELARLWAQHDTLDSKIAKLQQRYEDDDDFDAADYVSLVNRLRAKVNAIEGQIREHKPPPRAADLGDDVLATWLGGGFADRREILTAVVERIVLDPVGKVGPVRARAMVPETTTIIWA
jgi:site-specific DNA recombinase